MSKGSVSGFVGCIPLPSFFHQNKVSKNKQRQSEVSTPRMTTQGEVIFFIFNTNKILSRKSFQAE